MEHEPCYHVYRDKLNNIHQVDHTPDIFAIRSVKQIQNFKLHDLVT